MMRTVTGDHYVYQYVDAESRETAYVGYGKSASRAISHGTSHNRNLKEWLKSATYEIRIAGPYETEAVALDVESAVISATNPRFNVQPGNARRFRALGVPDDAAELRGRRIAGLRFGRAKWEHYLLVDGLGTVIWPPVGPSDQNG